MEIEEVINCKLIEDCNDPDLECVERTYTDSFPETERRDFSLVRQLHKENEKFNVYAIYKRDSYVGFITSWKLDDFMYIEHFAIDESARNGGIGGKIMREFISLNANPVILEVETPTDEMSQRRIGFYERLGFVLDSHPYQQPPYRSGGDWIDMHLMSRGEIDLTNSFNSIKDALYKNVYNQ